MPTQQLITNPPSTSVDSFLSRPFGRWLSGTLESIGVATLSMILVSGLATAIASTIGASLFLQSPEGIAVVMTVDCALGLLIWMLHRRRTTRAIALAIGALAAAFALPLPPYFAGLISGDSAVLIGHVLVIPALALACAVLPRELGASRAAGSRLAPATPARVLIEPIAARWPTVLALLLTFELMLNPTVVPAPILILLGTEYVVIGWLRREFRKDRLLVAHIGGAVAYAALAGLSMTVPPLLAGILIATGWLLHVGWDAALHRVNRVVWRWYAEGCAVVDLVVGTTVLLALPWRG
ncbi:hypothetical protein [Microbacterium wangchenii]|uniref:hypothetical protein n=1 Tax=Microbacterium wangchenii TaxID=2541726 RepID=UPI0011CB1F19|nr:hypothetical protein [Microbacterium wangchenii]TXK14814.1 hypothetical protein FVP99_14115 [Microbacterium wangchenii]